MAYNLLPQIRELLRKYDEQEDLQEQEEAEETNG